MTMFQFFVFTTLLALSANGFVVVDQRKASSTCSISTCSSSSSSQLMALRRDFLSNTAAVAAAIWVLPNVAEATTTAEKIADTPKKPADTKAATVSGSFQGVFSDPKHPKGYRVIVAKGSAATMSLSDGGANSKLFNLPVKVNKGKDGTTLTIDFSPKGGPKNIIGTLASDGSSISFPDGNKWKKNVGLEGVYKSSKNSQYRVIRKDKGSNLIVELRDNKLPTLIMAKSGASKKEGVYVDIQFPVKVKSDDVKANLIKGSFENGIISFPDGNKWTKM
mmetsp:Transcript_12869/g.14090  ORF Transcript_12869/g.14090 Transcript_12869/m.14090 type:complete len:277 (-) Transcript_12869:97-927(-)